MCRCCIRPLNPSMPIRVVAIHREAATRTGDSQTGSPNYDQVA